MTLCNFGEVIIAYKGYPQFNCFRKKSQKTPKKEIEKALRLKVEYYAQRADFDFRTCAYSWVICPESEISVGLNTSR